MQSPLAGRSILIVDDEPIIGMDLEVAFARTGAVLTTTGSLQHALLIVEDDGLAGAIVDYKMQNGADTSKLCGRLKERGIPFIVYSGWDNPQVEGALIIEKPAAIQKVVAAMEGLVTGKPIEK